MSRPVLVDADGAVCIITLNRPHVRNAIDLPLRIALAEAIEAADSDPSVRAIVLTGGGGVFCSGGDITTMARMAPEQAAERIRLAQRVIRAIWNTPKPVLAAVEGSAVGAGTSLAAACDRVVAAHDARFATTFTNVGLSGDMGVFASLPARVGIARARQMLLLPTPITAAEALSWGLVDTLSEPGRAVVEACADARRLAAAPAEALGVIKSMLAVGPTTNPLDVLEMETEHQARLFDTGDFAEGISAFREKRRPKFGAGQGSSIMTSVIDPAAGTGSRYGQLIQHDRVHGSLYTDPTIFAEELQKIWYRTWVFVGHESEIPEPNDYVRKKLGPQDVIMTRDREGCIHLLLNRCAHRGNQVCDDAKGNSGSFRCPYHGWTFRNTGELIGFPFFKGYGQRELDLAMGRVTRVDSYQGFVFGSFAADGPSLREHLGAAAGEIDRLTRLSPEGRVALNTGWLQHQTGANWKLLAENETDGYHPQFVHGSIFGVTGSPIGALYSDSSTAVTRDLGNGHSENDLRPEFRKHAEPMRWFGTTESRVPDYVAAMRQRHGTMAEQILVEGAPHVMIFPNLFIAEIQVFNIQPVSVRDCVQYSTAVQLAGAPELNSRMVSQCVGSVGPAGMLLADDTEMYERNQRGIESLTPEWLDVRRGLNRERVDDNGFTIGAATDETGMRGFWSHYKTLMETP